ncbi:MAG: DUF2326 domain-containing protein [Bacteroidota bacterium]
MKLKKLYTIPTQLFDTVIFHDGINFIFGIKDDTDESLNGIGKSLLLDFLDFTLLGSFTLNNNSRLNRAYDKANLKGHSAVLEFEIGKTIYVLTRSFDNPQTVFLSKNRGVAKDYSIKKIQEILFPIVYSSNYKGAYDISWLRRITKFFLKIQKMSDQKFTDPIKFSANPEIELNQYHLFLWNLDNTLASLNFSINKQIDDNKKLVSLTKQFMKDKFETDDFTAAQKKISELQKLITKYQHQINDFNLKDGYDELESRLNEITSLIKSITLLNVADQLKIQDLDHSLKQDDKVNIEYVSAIYEEFGSLLAEGIKKTLEEAKEFRKLVFDSRDDFVKFQKSQLLLKIDNRNNDKDELTNEQQQIMKTLSQLNALPDFKSVFKKHAELVAKKSELQSKINMFRELNKDINKLKSEDKELLNKVDDFISDNSDQIENITSRIKDIYTAIFGALDSPNIFEITKNTEEQKLKINVLPDDVYSNGKNQGRTLVYDLALLFNAIDQNISCPRFLVHDGIFDSLDKSHFISLFQLCEQKLKEKKNFQYIVTLNEQGTFDERFGEKDKLVTREMILNKSIAVLSPSKKLLKMDFK